MGNFFGLGKQPGLHDEISNMQPDPGRFYQYLILTGTLPASPTLPWASHLII